MLDAGIGANRLKFLFNNNSWGGVRAVIGATAGAACWRSPTRQRFWEAATSP